MIQNISNRVSFIVSLLYLYGLAILAITIGLIVIGVRDSGNTTIINNITNVTNNINTTNDLVIQNFTGSIGSTSVNFTLLATSSAFYTRLGNQITVYFYLKWNGTNGIGGVSALRVRLPFPVGTTIAGINDPIPSFSIGIVNGIEWDNMIVAVANYPGLFSDATNWIFFFSESVGVVPGAAPIVGNDISSTGEIAISGSYITDVVF